MEREPHLPDVPARAFTVDEANALVPVVEAAFQHIDRCRAEALERFEKLQVLDLLWGERLAEPGNPDHDEAAAHHAAIAARLKEIEEVVRREITARGIRFPQGGLDHGLVDFPTTWHGRWVYLCWRRGEPAVLAWHEMDAGFAGRRALTGEQEGRMGREGAAGEPDDTGPEP